MSATPKPGRPEVGPNINVRLPQDLLERVDQRAEAEGQTRAEVIRDSLSTARGMIDSTERTQERLDRGGGRQARAAPYRLTTLRPLPGTPGECRRVTPARRRQLRGASVRRRTWVDQRYPPATSPETHVESPSIGLDITQACQADAISTTTNAARCATRSTGFSRRCARAARMAKAKRIRTKTTGVYRIGDRYEWVSRAGSGTFDTFEEACKAKARADLAGPVAAAVRDGSATTRGRGWPGIRAGRPEASPRAPARATARA